MISVTSCVLHTLSFLVSLRYLVWHTLHSTRRSSGWNEIKAKYLILIAHYKIAANTKIENNLICNLSSQGSPLLGVECLDNTPQYFICIWFQETLDWCNNVLELWHVHVPIIFPNFSYKTSLGYRQCDNQMSLTSLSCFVKKFCSFKIIVSLLDYTRTHCYVDVSYTTR